MSTTTSFDDTPEQLQEILKVAQEAALLAGAEIRKASQLEANIQVKSASTDLVTETDQHCEDIIQRHIQQHFPSHQLIGEESSGQDKYQLSDAPTWTLDPIDGTTNFVHGLQMSCVLIAFLWRKQVLVGVCYDPYRDELFYATKGEGAFIKIHNILPQKSDIRPIHVSNCTKLNQAVISMDPGYGRDADAVKRFTTLQSTILQKNVRNIRVVGATGLNMAWVAAGRLDAGFEEGSWNNGRGPKIWDFAVGHLLIKEAGGVTCDIEPLDNLQLSQDDNSSLNLMGRSFFCAATPELAQELLQAIAEGRSKMLATTL